MSVQVRSDIVERLKRDLVGPGAEDEVFTDSPSDRYLTGILYPLKSQVPPEEDDDMAGSESDGEEEPDRGGAGLFMAVRPASAGMSFAVRSAGPASQVVFDVTCGTYARLDPATPNARPKWKRTSRKTTVTVNPPDHETRVRLAPEIEGLELYLRASRSDDVTMITAVVVNRNDSSAAKADDEQRSFFQVKLEARCGAGTEFAPRPSKKVPTDEDGAISGLIYRDAREYAVGHTCSVEWAQGRNGHVQSIATTWIPSSVVYAMSADGDRAFDTLRVSNASKPLSAEWLASARDTDLVAALDSLPAAYSGWLDAQQVRIRSLPVDLQARATENVRVCRAGLARMRSSIELLRNDAAVRAAFQLAQRAIVLQRRWTKRQPDLTWRPFQLGFQLLALESIANDRHPDRTVMDLLWFPTGGGKTEAYLALTAFILVLRRLKGAAPEAGDGVAVLMRYTLRLLTIQQFQRAAALVLACEHMRRGRDRPGSLSKVELGTRPFSVGLWVGGGATPNSFKDAVAALSVSGSACTPRQLLNCPCCGGVLTWSADRRTESVQVRCTSKRCDLAAGGEQLPVWTVDSDVYRERPSLVIATVDKFAQIARNVMTGSLFGLDRAGTRAPDLIIQDELHLISGPLGTLTGIYEVAIDALCTRGDVRPKVIGSTATIRRASQQIRALFDRDTYQFPPSCIDAGNSGFAVEDRGAPGRVYVGLTTVGRSPKFSLQAACASLIQSPAASTAPDSERDPYWTLVTYFNSLRELGGAVVLMLDDVPASVQQFANRRGEPRRTVGEPVELTSRVASSEIPAILEQLQVRCGTPGAVDVLLASNMISVGVDIPRLGLMVVNGQPKTIAEYIQATSRVGREFPGLVVAVYNHARVRDRSHFEAFPNWHTTLYREVEATSVTPFASRARDKALPAVLVAMARHLVAGMATDFRMDPTRRALLAPVVTYISKRAARIAPDEVTGVDAKLRVLLDEWQQRRDLASYWNDDGKTPTLLMSAEQFAAFGAEGQVKRAWPAPNSMREVEPGTPYRLRGRISGLAGRTPGGSDGE